MPQGTTTAKSCSRLSKRYPHDSGYETLRLSYGQGTDSDSPKSDSESRPYIQPYSPIYKILPDPVNQCHVRKQHIYLLYSVIGPMTEQGSRRRNETREPEHSKSQNLIAPSPGARNKLKTSEGSIGSRITHYSNNDG